MRKEEYVQDNIGNWRDPGLLYSGELSTENTFYLMSHTYTIVYVLWLDYYKNKFIYYVNHYKVNI